MTATKRGGDCHKSVLISHRHHILLCSHLLPSSTIAHELLGECSCPRTIKIDRLGARRQLVSNSRRKLHLLGSAKQSVYCSHQRFVLVVWLNKFARNLVLEIKKKSLIQEEFLCRKHASFHSFHFFLFVNIHSQHYHSIKKPFTIQTFSKLHGLPRSNTACT